MGEKASESLKADNANFSPIHLIICLSICLFVCLFLLCLFYLQINATLKTEVFNRCEHLGSLVRSNQGSSQNKNAISGCYFSTNISNL